MKTIGIVFSLLLAASVTGRDYNILDFGAKEGNEHINTRQIQAAIDQCTKEGGGRVVIPPGKFITGTLLLKDYVELHLEEKAVLMGSDRMADYPYIDSHFDSFFKNRSYVYGKEKTELYRSLIFSESTRQVAITGNGTIDGNGGAAAFRLGTEVDATDGMERPILILMIDCRGVSIRHVSLRNSGYWMQNYLACEDVYIGGIKVYNHCNHNNDGIDIDSRNVLVENCYIDSDDDGICLKSHDPDRYCENVVVRNCTVRSNCNGIKLGTGSIGGFRNIDIRNITLSKASEDNVYHWYEKLPHLDHPVTMLAGIAIENVDGGLTDNITVSNIHMDYVQTPVFIKLGKRMERISSDPLSPVSGRIRNVKIENVTATSYSKITSSITGYPGNDVENIELTNIHIRSMGKTSVDEVPVVVPENEKDYPENRMFGFVLPSSGLYVRHAQGITLRNITLETRHPEVRPDILLDNVHRASLQQIQPSAPANPQQSWLQTIRSTGIQTDGGKQF